MDIFHLAGDGIFCPGGSISNLYAFRLALQHYSNTHHIDLKYEGLSNHQFEIFCSDQAHYSLEKCMVMCGLGIKNLIKIKSDNDGCILIPDLINALDKSSNPLMIILTAGTTVLGAFDPIREIVNICRNYDIWIHVDASWGGSVIFSNSHQRLLDGIEEVDSLVWNPHKMMGIPLQCSIFLTRYKDILRESYGSQTEYIFQQDKCYDVTYDLGEKSFQCGRRNDVLKLWLPWKIMGDLGFSQHVEKNIRNAKYFNRKISQHPKFKLLQPQPSFVNICFWYWPHPHLNLNHSMISNLTVKIKEKMLKEGELMINYQPMGDLPNFFRMICVNSKLTYDDLDWIIHKIEKYGDEIIHDLPLSS